MRSERPTPNELLTDAIARIARFREHTAVQADVGDPNLRERALAIRDYVMHMANPIPEDPAADGDTATRLDCPHCGNPIRISLSK
jgi:hypothetical protein